MPYDEKTWKRRYAERSDLSTGIVHLTRDTESKKLVQVLFEIVSTGKIVGSTTQSGFIIGATPAVCFQDAPLHGICQNVFYEQKYQESNAGAKVRYRAAGLLLPKRYAYEKGARPVIYDKTSSAKQYVQSDQWWRIVNFDLSNENSIVDWTHEREWRAPGDFEFDIKEATLLFVNSRTYRDFVQLCLAEKRDYISLAKGVVVMESILY